MHFSLKQPETFRHIFTFLALGSERFAYVRAKKNMETTNEKDTAHSPVENRMISLRGQMVILDRDVANLYQVKTKHINQAVRNNPDKFPDGYVFELNEEESEQVKIFDQMSAKSHYAPKAFTEKGLYMLATILKGSEATTTTIRIIEAYAKMKEAGRNLRRMIDEEKEEKRKTLGEWTGNLLSSLLSDDLEIAEEEYSVEINLMAFKLSKTVKRIKK